MIAETSSSAYQKIKPSLGARQQEVYEAISDMGVATNEMVAEYLNLPINSVTGRVTELKRFGMLECAGIGRNKSGCSAKKWCIRDINDPKLRAISQDCGA